MEETLLCKAEEGKSLISAFPKYCPNGSGIRLSSRGVQGVPDFNERKKRTRDPGGGGVWGWVHKLGGNGLVHNTGEELLKYEPGGLSVMFGEDGIPGD